MQINSGKVRVFRWDPEKEIVDPAVFEGVDYIVHLAGANIGEKRWTKKRKEEIVKQPCCIQPDFFIK